MATAKNNIIQTKNPKTGNYVKINRSKGRITGVKKSAGPYKGVPIYKKTDKQK